MTDSACWRLATLLVTLAAVAVALGSFRIETGKALREKFTTRVEGQVRDEETGRPIKLARISLPELNQVAFTDDAGRLTLQDVPMPDATLPITITVTARGYREWSLHGAPTRAGDTLVIHPRLGLTPIRIDVPQPGKARASFPPPDELAAMARDLSGQPLPSEIRVRVSGSPYHCDITREYTVETIPFSDYVRHVLPNEWRNDYAESVRAGAIAVKTYAWYWISRGGKWQDADVWDSTCDQVYNPAFELGSMNQAVNHTWNWRLTKNGQLFQTSYRANSSQCGQRENCLGQAEADQMADDGSTWDEILTFFYSNSLLSPVITPAAGGHNLRFFGNGSGMFDRVLVRVDDPNNSEPGPPVDVGAGDFTVEWWLRAYAADNMSQAITCGANENWRFGHTLLDRDNSSMARKYGVSLVGSRLALGVTGEDQGAGAASLTLCGTSQVTDGRWHHIAIQRRRADGWLWIFVDGELEASGQGPEGDISYPDDMPSMQESDPFLVIGAGKFDSQPETHPSFKGWIDELRFSDILRYATPFRVPTQPFTQDENTLALYAFDEGVGNSVADGAAHPSGPSPGVRQYGGGINGPEWGLSDLFMRETVFIVNLFR